MDIEDLSCRVLVSISKSIEGGRPDPRICDLAQITNISERHVYRLLRTLRTKGLLDRQRRFRSCVYQITSDGQIEVKQLGEYFRLS